MLGCWVCVCYSSGKLNYCCLFYHLEKIQLIIFKMCKVSLESDTKKLWLCIIPTSLLLLG